MTPPEPPELRILRILETSAGLQEPQTQNPDPTDTVKATLGNPRGPRPYTVCFKTTKINSLREELGDSECPRALVSVGRFKGGAGGSRLGFRVSGSGFRIFVTRTRQSQARALNSHAAKQPYPACNVIVCAILRFGSTCCTRWDGLHKTLQDSYVSPSGFNSWMLGVAHQDKVSNYEASDQCELCSAAVVMAHAASSPSARTATRGVLPGAGRLVEELRAAALEEAI